MGDSGNVGHTAHKVAGALVSVLLIEQSHQACPGSSVLDRFKMREEQASTYLKSLLFGVTLFLAMEANPN